MPVLMIMQWKGLTQAQYDAVRELVNWENDVPAGGMYHAAAFSEEGAHVVDVWETAEAFERFAESRLMPGIALLGIPGEPNVQMHPVHRLFAPAYDHILEA
jgi:hypothetical protein